MPVRERAKNHVLVRWRGVNGKISNGHVILSPTSCFSFFLFENLSVSLHSLQYSAIQQDAVKPLTPQQITFLSHPLHRNTTYSHSICPLAFRGCLPPNLHHSRNPFSRDRALSSMKTLNLNYFPFTPRVSSRAANKCFFYIVLVRS